MTILTPNQQTMPSPDATYKGVPFTALLCVEGLETSDGRMFEIGSTTWRDMPIPFMVQDTTAHGEGQVPEPAWAAGQLDEIYRDPQDNSRILGHGHFMPTAEGQRAMDLMQHAFRGVSIDAYGGSPLPPEVQPTHVDEAGTPIAVLVRYNDSVISRVTMVPTPAFASCCVWQDDEPMPQVAQDAHGQVTPISTPPQVLELSDPYEQLVASSGGPPEPPRSWFFTPEPDRYQPIEVTPEGHITGHIAAAGQCHIGYVGKCETAPRSTTSPPFKAFHRTVARCEDGSEVACGWLTIDTKHQWDFGADANATADYYDHTGTLVAKLRASNGRHGIWASGSAVPGLGDREAWLLQGPEVSGDWRRYVDPDTQAAHNRELLSVLAVPVPGFPGHRTRPELLVASGEIVAQRGQLDPCDCEEGEAMTPEERAEFDALKTKVDGLATMVASGAPLGKTITQTFSGTPPSSEQLAEMGLRLADNRIDPAQLHAHALTVAAAVGLDPAAVESMATSEIVALVASAQQTKLESEADALIASIDGVPVVDLNEPLSASEQANYYAAYDKAAREKLAKQGKAMPDLSYPIDNVDDLKAAIRGVGRGSGSHNAIRKHIMKNAKRLGEEKLIPADWGDDGSVKSAA